MYQFMNNDNVTFQLKLIKKKKCNDSFKKKKNQI